MKTYKAIITNPEGNPIFEQKIKYVVLDDGEVCSDLLPNTFVVEIEDAIKEDIDGQHN